MSRDHPAENEDGRLRPAAPPMHQIRDLGDPLGRRAREGARERVQDVGLDRLGHFGRKIRVTQRDSKTRNVTGEIR